jgi:hypothetical protein
VILVPRPELTCLPNSSLPRTQNGSSLGQARKSGPLQISRQLPAVAIGHRSAFDWLRFGPISIHQKRLPAPAPKGLLSAGAVGVAFRAARFLRVVLRLAFTDKMRISQPKRPNLWRTEP